MAEASSKLWYDKPANEWNEALPLGNGRLGCMVHGRTGTGLLCLNEDSVWYGGPQERIPKDALKNLPRLRELVREGQHTEAEKLAQRTFGASPSSQRHYEPSGSVKIEYGHDWEKVTGYRRELDLDTAVHTTEYTYDESRIKIEVLASAIDQVIAIRIRSSSRIDLVVKLMRESEEGLGYLDTVETTQNRIVMLATAGGYQSVRVWSALGVTTDKNGTVEAQGGSLVVNAKEALIVVTARTTFRHKDFEALAIEDVSAAFERGADKIWNDHIRDYQSLYHRMKVTLGPSSHHDTLPTDQRITQDATPALVALCTNYSRYLLLFSSMPSNSSNQSLDLPANLQGVWNPSFHPASGSKFFLDISLQMNYWGCLPLSLSSCMGPYFSLLYRLALPENGGKVAKKMYGARGWCCHTSTSIWADCSPSGHSAAALWPLGGAWLSSFIWEHYLFTSDLCTLRKNFPVLQGAVEFCLDWLICENLSDGKKYRVNNPSLSPHNNFFCPQTHQQGTFCRGSTADLTIISSLFEDYLKACKVLALKPHLLREVGKTMLALPPPSICKKTGRLQEWGMDNHTDIKAGKGGWSHLVGVYPFTCIDMDASPELSRAALRSLEIRLASANTADGKGEKETDLAHLMCIFSRLRMPDKVAETFSSLLSNSTLPNLLSTSASPSLSASSSPNLLSTSTPTFPSSNPSININVLLGASAAITESLLQSFEITGSGQRVLRILPSWPREWSDGEVRGVRCRGGWSVSYTWRDGVVVGAVVVRRVVGEDGGKAGEEGGGGRAGGEGGKEKEGYRNRDVEERKGVVVFPDGEVVAFEGVGPHFCQAK